MLGTRRCRHITRVNLAGALLDRDLDLDRLDDDTLRPLPAADGGRSILSRLVGASIAGAAPVAPPARRPPDAAANDAARRAGPAESHLEAVGPLQAAAQSGLGRPCQAAQPTQRARGPHAPRVARGVRGAAAAASLLEGVVDAVGPAG